MSYADTEALNVWYVALICGLDNWAVAMEEVWGEPAADR